MTSPLEAYLRENPQLREQDRGKLIEELYQTSGVDAPYSEFTQKLLRDPDNPSGQRFAEKAGKREPSEEAAEIQAAPSALGARSIFGDMISSAGRAATLPGDVYNQKIPQYDPKTGRTSDEMIERSGELAGWATLPDAAGAAMAGRRGLAAAATERRLKASRPPAPDDAIRGLNELNDITKRLAEHPDRKPGELTSPFDRFYARVKDKYHAFNRAEKEVTGEWAGSPDAKLLAEESPFKLLRLMGGNAGRAEHFLESGTYDFTTNKVTGPSLKAIVTPVEGDMKAAMTYALAKRAIEKEAQGISTGIDKDYALQVVRQIEGTDTPLAKSIVKFQQDLQGYNDALLKMVQESGMLSKEEYAAIKSANADYIPFYRLLDEKLQGATPGRASKNPIKSMKGSELEILDPMESMIRNTYAFIHIAERNRAAQALYRLVEMDKEGVVGQVVPIPTKAIQASDAEIKNFLKQYDIETDQPGAFTLFRPTDTTAGNIIEFKIDGKRKAISVDPEIALAWKQLDGFSADMLTNIMGAPARMLRAGVTLDPGFSLRNFFRDQFMPLLTMPGMGFTKESYRPFYDAQLGLSQILHNGPHYLEWMRSGGANATQIAIDQQYLKILRERLVGGSGVENALFVAKHPIEALRYVSNMMENATRVGGYMRARNAGYSAMDAAFISREMTIDFARIGQQTQWLNRVAAFANAQAEGPDRMFRSFAARPGAAALSVVGGVTAPSMALWAINHDDPRYKQMPRWQKDIYWPLWVNPDWRDVTEQEAAFLKESLPTRTLPSGKMQANYGKPLLLPKPFEVGVIFGSLPERIAEKYIDDNPQAAKDFIKSLSRAMLPNMMPTFMGPQLEIQSNYSFYFDRPIVSRSLQDLVPELRFTEYTSETAKSLSKILNKALDPIVDDPEVTPIAVEHWVRNWTGTMGQHALNVLDWSLKKSGVVPKRIGPESTLADWPILRSFTTRHPTTLAQSISDFYNEYFKQERLTKSIRELGKRADSLEEQEILRASRNVEKVKPIYEAMRFNAQAVNDIMRDPSMNEQEKRALIDQHIFRAIGAASEGLRKLRLKDEKPKPEERDAEDQIRTDLRVDRFGAMQSNDGQLQVLKQMSLPEQLKFAPYAHADTKAKVIIWFDHLTAEQQDTILDLSDEETTAWWLAYSKEPIQKKYGYGGPSLNPPNVRKQRAPAPEKPSWGTRPPTYPNEGKQQPRLDQRFKDLEFAPGAAPSKPDPLPGFTPSWSR